MSSQIPTRRTTRATRLQDENAVSGRQPTTRAAKAASTLTATGTSKPTCNTALDANAQNKRKREAFTEVTNNNKNKNVARGISKDGKPVKPHVLTKPATRPNVQGPVRKTKISVPATETLEVSMKEQDDDAMIVDEPVVPQPLQRVSRRLSTRTKINVTATASVTSIIPETQAERTDVATTRRVKAAVEEQDDEAEDRVVKRRRTSSEAGDEDVAEEEVEFEASPVDVSATEAADEVKDEEKEVKGWEDLDKEDFDDPMMVSEYVVDIFKYLSECEERTLPKSDYMKHQAELRWSQRGVLMDYLLGMHQEFHLCPETLHLAVNLIDRFLSLRVVSLVKLQLVGLACLFVAGKYEEVFPPTARHYIKAAAVQDEIKEEDIYKAEKYILKTLEYTVGLYPQPMNWLRRINKADNYDAEVRTVAKFFLDIHVVERKLVAEKPSLLAAASIWLARLVLDQTDWTPNLAHYSGYTEKRILPVASIMLNYCLRLEQHEQLKKKYATRKFHNTSSFVHEWVTKHWRLGSKISLDKELPFLKALAAEKKREVLL